MSPVLYGIPNCDTVKKARAWLAGRGIDFRFHDFKKDGLDAGTIAGWMHELDWESLLNRRGTTWRGLPEASRNAVVDAQSATALMLASPSVIKRPVLVQDGGATVLGFSESLYQQIFEGKA
ncbi:MAG: ArsC family reductase [Paucimonas sp.]|nr:ArsC family reductase [Paucimonas sp.]